MSWQAMEAVQDNSTVEDSTGLVVFLAIARHANAEGVAGANGKHTSPKIDTIAQTAHVHRNTVLNWLPQLEATGELTVHRNGKGRGAWNQYIINLPMSNGTPQDVPINKENSTPETTNSEIAELVQTVHQLKEMVQEWVHNGTSQGVPDTNDTEIDTNTQPTAEGSAQPEKPSKKQVDIAKAELERHFAIKTSLPLPNRATAKQRRAAAVRWWNPLEEIYRLGGYDVDRSKRIMDMALAQMDGLTFDAPESIMKTARSVYAKSERGVSVSSVPNNGLTGTLRGLTGI